MKTIKSLWTSLLCFVIIPFTIVFGTLFVSYWHFTARVNQIDTTSNQPKETIALINELQEEYGFNIHIGINPADYQNPILKRLTEGSEDKYYYSNIDNLDQERIYNFLSEFKRVCGSYTKEQLEEIPREIFLTNDFYMINEYNMMTNFSIGLTVSVGADFKKFKIEKPIYLIFSVADGGLTFEHVIEHEFMHCFEYSFDKETAERVKNLNLNCEDISAYACTNYSEMIAEAYAEGFIDRELIKK